MTMFENLKSMNIDEFASWFEENCIHDNDPCIRWFDETYCQNCEAIVKDGMEYGYCELNDKCRYFNDIESIPSAKETIKMWLESECKKEHQFANHPRVPDDYYFEVGM